jgi:hypothetical protein
MDLQRVRRYGLESLPLLASAGVLFVSTWSEDYVIGPMVALMILILALHRRT